MNKVPRRLFGKGILSCLRKSPETTWPCVRHYLSSSYKCEKVWQERLESPVLKDIDVGNFAVRLQEKLDKEGQVPAIDIDIFANKLEFLDPYQLDYALSVISRFRNTAQTGATPPSMQHAVIRALLKFGETKRLLYILNHRLEYGIFLDQYSANMCMSDLIEKEAYYEAGLVAIELMLIEGFGSDLTRLMSIYCSHMALEQTPYEKLSEEVNPSDPEPEDEELVRVHYIINPWYDDHWDLPTVAHRLGKTLAMATNGASFTEDKLNCSIRLLGLAHWQKFELGVELLQTLANSDGKISINAVDQFHKLLSDVDVGEYEEVEIGMRRLHHVRPIITEEDKSRLLDRVDLLRGQLKNNEQLISIDITADIKTRLDAAQRLEEAEHISSLESLYTQWNATRKKVFEQYIEEIEKQKKKIAISERLKKLTRTEEKLSFFKQRGKIELGIVKSEKLSKKYDIKEVTEEEQFVPPPQERGKAF